MEDLKVKMTVKSEISLYSPGMWKDSVLKLYIKGNAYKIDRLRVEILKAIAEVNKNDYSWDSRKKD